MKRLKKILSEILEIDEETITDETSPDNVESWDSFNGLMLVVALENSFNVKFTMEEIVSVKCVGDIKYYLEKHGVVLEGE